MILPGVPTENNNAQREEIHARNTVPETPEKMKAFTPRDSREYTKSLRETTADQAAKTMPT
jgi:hypothetical protein